LFPWRGAGAEVSDALTCSRRLGDLVRGWGQTGDLSTWPVLSPGPLHRVSAPGLRTGSGPGPRASAPGLPRRYRAGASGLCTGPSAPGLPHQAFRTRPPNRGLGPLRRAFRAGADRSLHPMHTTNQPVGSASLTWMIMCTGCKVSTCAGGGERGSCVSRKDPTVRPRGMSLVCRRRKARSDSCRPVQGPDRGRTGARRRTEARRGNGRVGGPGRAGGPRWAGGPGRAGGTEGSRRTEAGRTRGGPADPRWPGGPEVARRT